MVGDLDHLAPHDASQDGARLLPQFSDSYTVTHGVYMVAPDLDPRDSRLSSGREYLRWRSAAESSLSLFGPRAHDPASSLAEHDE